MNDVVCKHGWSRSFCEPCSSAHIISQLKGPRDMGMLAIKPENVPDAVWHTAMSTYHKAIKKRPGSAWQEAIAAALNAWPGMEFSKHLSVRDDGEGYCLKRTGIHLPLPTEASDE